MKSRASEFLICICLFLSLSPLLKTASAQTNQCVFSGQSQSVVSCERGQVAVCLLRDGRVEGRCKTPPATARTAEEGDAYQLSGKLKSPLQKFLATEDHYTGWPGRGFLGSTEFDLREDIQRTPNEPAAHYELGAVLLSKGRYLEAEQEFLKAGELAKPGNPDLEVLARQAVGGALFSQGKYLEAEHVFRDLADICTSSRSASCQINGPIHRDLALTLAAQRKYSEATETLQALAKTNPGYPYLYNFMAAILVELGELDKAEAAFRKGVEVENSRRLKSKYNYYEVHQDLFVFLISRGKIQEAKVLIAELSLAKGKAWSLFGKGLLHLRERNFHAAEVDFSYALALEPTNELFMEGLKTTQTMRRQQ